MNAELLALLKDMGVCFFFSGSSVTVDPPVLNTDLDAVVLLQEDVLPQELMEAMTDLDWDFCGDYDNGVQQEWTQDMMAFRRGVLNLIFVKGKAAFDKWVLAHSVCAYLNLPNKNHRIAVYQAIRHGLKPHEVVSTCSFTEAVATRNCEPTIDYSMDNVGAGFLAYVRKTAVCKS